MNKSNARASKQEDKTKRDLIMGNVLPSQKHNVDIAVEIRSLHADPILRTRDESTDTHYVGKFMFKVNNTFSITKVSLNKDPEKPRDLEAHTLKAQINKVKTTRAERFKDIIKLAKELKEKQGETGQEEEFILLQSCHPLKDLKPVAKSLEIEATEEVGPSQPANQEDPQPSDTERVETTSRNGPKEE